MVDCTCLENRSLGNRTVSSNLTSSALRQTSTRALVVQWIEFKFAVLAMQVRFLPRAHNSKRPRSFSVFYYYALERKVPKHFSCGIERKTGLRNYFSKS